MTTSPTLPRRSPDEQQHLESQLRDLFDRRISFHQIVGFHVAQLTPDSSALSFEMRPELIGNYLYGRLHGGVIASALDACGGLAVMAAIAEKFAHENAEQVAHRFGKVGTIDLRTDFLRQGIGKRFVASGQVTRLGGRIASAQMRLESEAGLLIATGGASYVVS